jgi:hypothetical protein
MERQLVTKQLDLKRLIMEGEVYMEIKMRSDPLPVLRCQELLEYLRLVRSREPIPNMEELQRKQMML